jgi:hypothetical protein
MVAEAVQAAGDTPRATELCARAGPLAEDCARHLWKRAVAADPDVPLPPPPHQDRAREQLRHLQPMRTTPCAGAPACEALAVEILARRWDRDATDPSLRAALCGGDLAALPPRLRWDPDSPALVAGMEAYRARTCP